MSQAVVREAQPEDASSIADLLAQFDEDPANQRSPESMEQFLRKGSSEIAFVAEVGSKLVGFLTLQLTDSLSYTRPTAEVTAIFVGGGYRRGGVGLNLMDAAIRRAQDERALELFLRVNIANVSAIQFYECCGLNQADHLEYRLTCYGGNQHE